MKNSIVCLLCSIPLLTTACSAQAPNTSRNKKADTLGQKSGDTLQKSLPKFEAEIAKGGDTGTTNQNGTGKDGLNIKGSDSILTERPFFLRGGVAKIKEKIKTPQVKKHSDYVLKAAGELIAKDANNAYLIPLIKPIAGKLDQVAKDFYTRVISLGFASKITGDFKYMERMWQEIGEVSNPTNFPTWIEPEKEISLGMFAHGLALAYDFLHPDLTTTQKQFMKDVLIQTVLTPAGAFYSPTPTPWADASKPSYYNFVINNGLILSLLSFELDKNAESTEGKLYKSALASLKSGMKYFNVNGSTTESLSSWADGVGSLASTISGLLALKGSDEGVLSNAGLALTGDFFVDLSSNLGRAFNFYESKGMIKQPVLHWLSEKFNLPHLRYYAQEVETISVGESYQYILYYLDSGKGELFTTKDTAKLYSGAELVSFRNDWSTENGLFLALKGGNHLDSQSRLDHGSFQFEADGQVWFSNLPAEETSVPNFFAGRGDSKAIGYNYYRVRAEGNNTFVLNPSATPDQSVGSTAHVSRFKQTAKMASIYLTKSYINHGISAERGAAIIENGTAAIVRDQITMASKIIYYNWMAHTQVKKAKYFPGSKSAVILENALGKKLLVYVVEPGFEFKLGEDGTPLNLAVPLGTSPNPVGQSRNDTWRKLVLIGQSGAPSAITATVVMYPLSAGAAEAIPKLTDFRITNRVEDWGFTPTDTSPLANFTHETNGDTMIGRGTYVSTGYKKTAELGSIYNTPRAGASRLLQCLSGTEYRVTKEATCNGGKIVRSVGFILDSPAPEHLEIFNCQKINNTDIFVSLSKNCDGETALGSLGFIPK
jgi:hypothetical protein